MRSPVRTFVMFPSEWRLTVKVFCIEIVVMKLSFVVTIMSVCSCYACGSLMCRNDHHAVLSHLLLQVRR